MNDKSDEQFRMLFTQIGIIMEDASMIALIWRESDGLTIMDRLAKVKIANDQISALLEQLEANVR